MICAVVFLLILYYFYDEINRVKKLFVPAYQKTMELEAKVLSLEKKAGEWMEKNSQHSLKITGNTSVTKSKQSKNDSPAYSITYFSDVVRNPNASIKYCQLSETETREIMNKSIAYGTDKQNIYDKLTNDLVKEDITKNISDELLDDFGTDIDAEQIKTRSETAPVNIPSENSLSPIPVKESKKPPLPKIVKPKPKQANRNAKC
jgi:signal recognition particle GTPase